jgi:hypothetical protein
MRMSLYDAAFATIARVNSDAAGDSIVRVTVIAGLESTMFWPLGRWIAAYAWRGALIVSAAVSLANALLLCYFCDHSAGEAGHDLGRIRAGVSAGEDSSTGSRDDVLHRHGARQHGEPLLVPAFLCSAAAPIFYALVMQQHGAAAVLHVSLAATIGGLIAAIMLKVKCSAVELPFAR